LPELSEYLNRRSIHPGKRRAGIGLRRLKGRSRQLDSMLRHFGCGDRLRGAQQGRRPGHNCKEHCAAAINPTAAPHEFA